jgi:hypothetical protein
MVPRAVCAKSCDRCMPSGAVPDCRHKTRQGIALREAKTYVCGSRLRRVGMEIMGKQGSIAREYLRMALSGSNDPSF